MGTRHSTGSGTPATTSRFAAIASGLAAAWPNATVELDFRTPFELLAATILAAQSTDKMINTITPALFAQYPDARALAVVEPIEIEPLIFKSGFYRNKAKSLVGMARALVERHGGEVPRTMAQLVELPGVARKTANVVLGCAFGIAEGVIVDTHVTRLAQRLGLTKATEPVAIEQDLMAGLPRAQWTRFANQLIFHGRRVCFAKAPDCDHCTLAPSCPSAHHVVAAGAKPAKPAKPAKLAKLAKPAKLAKSKAKRP